MTKVQKKILRILNRHGTAISRALNQDGRFIVIGDRVSGKVAVTSDAKPELALQLLLDADEHLQEKMKAGAL